MDTTDPDISFNTQGYCSHCSTYFDHISPLFETTYSNNNEVLLLEKIKGQGKNKPYDCIVGISGGVDSCYTAYWAHSHGLRVLLVHLDNGWNTDISVKNIRKIAQAFNFDFESVVLDWSEFKEIQLAFLRASIVDLELPTDLAIPAVLHQIAAKHKVQSILSGGNYSSEGILPLQWGYHVTKDMHLYNHIVRKYGKVKRKLTPAFGIRQEAYYKLVKRIKTYYPLNFGSYDKEVAKAFLSENVGCDFKEGKHHESKYTAFWQSYIMPIKYGFDYRRATYSTLICSKQLTREVALKLLELPAYDASQVDENKRFIANKFNITVEEFEALIALPPRTYKDFPNHSKLIHFIHSAYNKLFN